MTEENELTGWRAGLANWVANLFKWTIGMCGELMGNILVFGFETFINRGHDDVIDIIRDRLDELASDPDAPEEIRTLAGKMHSPIGPVGLVILTSIIVGMVMGPLQSMMQPLLDKLGLKSMNIARSALINPDSTIKAFWRDPNWADEMIEVLGRWGYPENQQKMLELSERPWLDAAQLALFKFRTKGSDAEYLASLKQLGFTEDEAKKWLEIIPFYPSAQDLVTWLAREVFEDDMVTKYGLDDERPSEETKVDLFRKAGVNEEQMTNYWRAHWQHPAFNQVIQMLRRGVLTADDGVPVIPDNPDAWDTRDSEGAIGMYEWFKLVEIPPFWRNKLEAMSWAIPTRVDVRRFWDMATIDETRLRQIYHSLGYHGKDLEDYVLWTKVYVAFPDWVARFKKGWVTKEETKDAMIGFGMDADRFERMWETKFEPESNERTEKERDLTKTEIYKGVDGGLLTKAEGIELLMDMGYSNYEADYIITLNTEQWTNSPGTFYEYKFVTQWARMLQGKQFDLPPMELGQAEFDFRWAWAAYLQMEEDGKPKSDIRKAWKVLKDAESRYISLKMGYQSTVTSRKGQPL